MTYCAVCKEKERLIAMLADQIDWLRARAGDSGPSAAVSTVGERQGRQPEEPDFAELFGAAHTTGDEPPYVSEDEQDLAYMVKHGLVDREHAAEALAQMRSAE